MAKKVNWGILGTADIAKKCTIPAMLKADNCNLYGIAGRSEEKVNGFKNKFNFERAYYSYEAMLEDENIQAVYIPLPNHLHKEWVMKAAKKGKHVLCEKPLAGSKADVQEMVQVCKEEGVFFMEAFAYLHSPVIKAVKDVIDSGEIGKVTYIESTFLTPAPPAEDHRMRRERLGGSLYDLGCYTMSLTLALLDEEPNQIKSTGFFTDKNIDELAVAILNFPSGVKASMTAGMCSGQRGDRYFIYGTEGIIEAPVPFNEEGELKFHILKDGKKEKVKVTARDNYTLEVEQFGRCILHGEELHVSNEFSIKNASAMDKVLVGMGY